MDVIVTSTCRKTIEKTIQSFLKNVKYKGRYRFLVNIDVKNNIGYLPRLEKFLKDMSIHEVNVNMQPKENLKGLIETTNLLYNKIETDYYFNLQDDWIFLEKIDLDKLVALLNNNPEIDHIRLNKKAFEEYEWLYHLSDENRPEFRKKAICTSIDNINLIKISTWSLNPSLCRTKTVLSMLPVPDDVRVETYLCHKYDEIYSARGSFVLGSIGDKARIKDIGRNPYRKAFKKVKNRLLNLIAL